MYRGMSDEDYLKHKRPYYFEEDRPWMDENLDLQGRELGQQVSSSLRVLPRNVATMRHIMCIMDKAYLVSMVFLFLPL